MTKRARFILISVILSLGFIGIQFLPEQFAQYRYQSIGGLSIASVLLFYWALSDGLGLNMTLSTLILPFFYTIGVGLFWFLLPSEILARIPIVIVYGVGIYAMCLTANIYTVATLRTIALFRAARGVGFVMTLFTMFLLFDAIFSLRVNYYITAPLVALTSFPLFLQGFWSVKLSKRLTTDILVTSLVSTLIMLEAATLLFFWPVTVIVGSLFLTVAAYMLLGLGQTHLEERLFPQTVKEYLYVGIAVFIGMFFATRWGG